MEPIAQTPPPDFTPVEGASFPVLIKLASTLLMGAVLIGAWRAGPWALWQQLSTAGMGFVAAAAAVMVAGYWGILTSRTRFDGQVIHQSWLWAKAVPLAEITQVKLIEVRGLAWLIVPRLVVRAGGMKLITFHAADPAVLAAFRRLAYGG